MNRPTTIWTFGIEGGRHKWHLSVDCTVPLCGSRLHPGVSGGDQLTITGQGRLFSYCGHQRRPLELEVGQVGNCLKCQAAYKKLFGL